MQYRAEKAGVVHAGIGKASFDEAKIVENAAAFIDAVRKARPTGAKGQYIKKITISSTMGAGVFVEDVGRPIEANNHFPVAGKPAVGNKGVNAICRCPAPVQDYGGPAIRRA